MRPSRDDTVAKKPQRVNARLFLFKKLLLVLLLLSLDVRDVVYKLTWIGPADSYSFRAGSSGVLHAETLVSNVTNDSRALDAGEHVVSGWSSFLSQCEELHAIGAKGGGFFLSAMGKNCVVRVASGTRTIPQLVMTSSIRADAPIWASCLFLHLGRRPSVCQDRVATGFNQRYAFSATKIYNSDVAPVGSDAEAEILRFLDLISASVPLYRVVCVEAFELAEGATGTFTADIFGCASPNVFRSEFVGLAATQYKRLLHGKAWLTNDEISLLGAQFGIRQNGKSDYVVGHDDTLGELTLRSKTLVNFSSYGSLYALMIAIDVWLLLAHCQSVLEIFKWMLLPKYRELQQWTRDFETARDSKLVVPEHFVRHHELQQDEHRMEPHHAQSPDTPARDGELQQRKSRRQYQHLVQQQQQSHHQVQHRQPRADRKQSQDGHHPVVFREERFYAFFGASHYKRPVYVWLVRLTRVISWVIVMPNSVVWTWSDSQNEKFQAYLSSVKVWVLISGAIKVLWHATVRLSEARAYRFVRGTYITNVEIIVIGALAAMALQNEIFLICEEKWAIENQRVNDAASFLGGFIAHGNTFQRENDYRTTTPFEIFQILYAPLIHIVLLSITAAVVWLVVKYAFFAGMAGVSAREWRRRSVVVVAGAGSGGESDAAPATAADAGPAAASVGSGGGDGCRTGEGSGAGAGAVQAPTTNSSDGGVPSSQRSCHVDENTRDDTHHHYRDTLDSREPYARLALEDALDIPIRAISLVRDRLDMEVARDGRRYIRPSCYLDYGIMLKHGAAPAHTGVAEIFRSDRMRSQDIADEDMLVNDLVSLACADAMGREDGDSESDSSTGP